MDDVNVFTPEEVERLVEKVKEVCPELSSIMDSLYWYQKVYLYRMVVLKESPVMFWPRRGSSKSWDPYEELAYIAIRGGLMSERRKGNIINRIGEAAMWEQLAEECVELAHAALKMARILRNENPTEASRNLTLIHVDEEYADVCMAANELGLKVDSRIQEYKMNRFMNHWDEIPHKEEE